jgi:hypothetical protein
MSDRRGQFVEHRGKRIYVVDFQGLRPEQVIAALPALAADIRSQPPKSVLCVTCVKDNKLDREMIERLKEFVTGNTPHVKAAAIVGLTSLQRALVQMWELVAGREFVLFDGLAEAKDHLASLK